MPIIHVIGPKFLICNLECFAVHRLETVSTYFATFQLSTLGYERTKCWWARPDLNWRSSPCQGDVITPRPRALATSREPYCIWMIRIWSVKSSNDFRNFTTTTWLRARATYSLAAITHGEVLDIHNRPIGLAF